MLVVAAGIAFTGLVALNLRPGSGPARPADRIDPAALAAPAGQRPPRLPPSRC